MSLSRNRFSFSFFKFLASFTKPTLTFFALLAAFFADAAAPMHTAQMPGVPLFFESNLGQAPAFANFISRGPNYEFLIAPTEAQLLLLKSQEPAPPLSRGQLRDHSAVSARVIRMQFIGANPEPLTHAVGELPGKINYFIGSDPRQWHRSIPTSAKVEVENLYPGIDLVYYGNHRQLEYDFVLQPGADSANICIHFEGVDKLALDKSGDLLLTLGNDSLRQPPPALYQVLNGQRQPVKGSYRLLDSHNVGFTVGPRTMDTALVIDPSLTYASYFGGSSANLAVAVKVDSAGSVYVAGGTLGSFAFTNLVNGFQTVFQGGTLDGDAYVAKFDSTLTNLVYFSYLGGTLDENAFDLALDSANNVYLTGYTDSTNFPIASAVQPSMGGIANSNTLRFPVDAFVTELDSTGSNLVYSTYLGGSDEDVGVGVAVDAIGDAYVTGYTFSTNFIPLSLRDTAFQPRIACKTNLSNCFIAKIGPNGGVSNLLYASYFGGTNIDQAEGIAVDVTSANGLAFITGFTTSTNFPIRPDTNTVYQWEFNGYTNATRQFRGVVPPTDAFVVEFDTTQSGTNSVPYSTYLGGTYADSGYRIATDPLTNVYVTGYTLSSNFAINATSAGLYSSVSTNINKTPLNQDAFLVKFNFASTPSAPLYSVVFGGTNADTGWDVAVNSTNVYVVGATGSTNFPTVSATGFLRSSLSGGNDAFVTSFVESNGVPSALYSAYVGGSLNDAAYGVAADDSGNAYVVGRTYSSDFPTQVPFQPSLLSSNNAFLAKISSATNALLLITFQTVPPNLTLMIDGTVTTNIAYPYVFSWSAGSIHTIYAPPVNGSVLGEGTNIQYVWTSWSDGGFIAHQVLATADASFTATFKTNYFLTMNVSNVTAGVAAGGAVSPVSGWFDAFTNVLITATPPIDNTFVGWLSADSTPGSYTGPNNPTNITMGGPITETALFSGLLTNRLTVVISGEGSVSPDYNGKILTVGHTYNITAKPGPGYVFSSWSGGTNWFAPTLPFVMEDGLVLQANFIPSPFIPFKGNYSGLFYETNRPRYQTSGTISASLGSLGEVSGTLRLANKTYSFSGHFNNSGAFGAAIVRNNLLPLSFFLQLDLSTQDTMTGQVTDGTFLSDIVVHRPFFSRTNTAPMAGKYTFAIDGAPDASTQPGGNGYGTISVDSLGNSSLSVTLGDGTKLSQGSFVSSDGQLPLFALLYSGKGSVISWLTFSNQPASDLSGSVSWFKPPQTKARLYPSGFTVQTTANGSRYAFTNGTPVLSLPNGTLVLTGGNLSQSLSNALTLNANNTITGTNNLNIPISTGSGLFHGSVLNPLTRKTISLNGALLQKQNEGMGLFTGTNQTGSIFLGP